MIIVDSNIFIFGESLDSPERMIALHKYKEAVKSGRIGTNVIIMSEVFHKLQKILGKLDAYSRVAAILNSPQVDFLVLDTESSMRALKLARDFNLGINDALIAQQAIETNASVLTDDVKDFRKIGSIKVIPLRQN